MASIVPTSAALVDQKRRPIPSTTAVRSTLEQVVLSSAALLHLNQERVVDFSAATLQEQQRTTAMLASVAVQHEVFGLFTVAVEYAEHPTYIKTEWEDAALVVVDEW